MLWGLVEGLLELLSQATGGATGVDELKEIVANAEAATINRSIEMLQSHRRAIGQGWIGHSLHSTPLHSTPLHSTPLLHSTPRHVYSTEPSSLHSKTSRRFDLHVQFHDTKI